MPINDLVLQIKDQLQLGLSRENITENLRVNWSDDDINAAWVAVNLSSKNLAPIPVESPTESAKSLLSIGELIGQTLEIYRKRFWSFVSIVSVTVFTVAVLGILYLGLFNLLDVSNNFTAVLFATTVVPLVSVVVVLGMEFWSYAALIYAVHHHDRQIGVVEAYKSTWTVLGPLSWVAFLFAYITAGGFSLFFIPGVFLAVAFSLSYYVVIIEGEKGMKALIKSREYMRDYWWDVFFRYVAIILVFFVGMGVLVSVAIVPIILVGLVGSNINFELFADIGIFIQGPLGLVLQILPAPFIVIYYDLIYRNLKSLKSAEEVDVEGKPGWGYVAIGVGGILFTALSVIVPIIFLLVLLFSN